MTAMPATTSEAPAPRRAPCIDVCVATYRRPGPLATLLGSLKRQATDGAFGYRVIVVDNDHRRSAEATVRRFAAEGLDVRYAVEPCQNIALARNRGFALSTAELIATIDDDEVAPPGWLASLLQAMGDHDADVVRGHVAFVFAVPPSPFVRGSRVYDMPNPHSGATEGFPMGSGNMLIRRTALAGHPRLFDADFGRTGGSDGEFFRRMLAAGARIVWSREAVVVGLVPRQRSTWRHVMLHEFRLGNTFDRVRHQPPQAIGTSLGEITQRLLALLRCAAIAPWERRRVAQGLVHFRMGMRSLGRLAHALGVEIEFYTETGPRLVLARTRRAGGAPEPRGGGSLEPRGVQRTRSTSRS